MLAIALIAGCQGRERTTHRAIPFADGARAVAIGDVDGDGHAELVVVDATQLRVLRPDGSIVATTSAPGGIQVLRVVDLDGDGKAEIVAGWGATRDQRDAPARIDRYRLTGGGLSGETITSPTTERAEIAAIVPVPPGLVIAWFESTYMVASARATPGAAGWTIEPIATLRMATSYARGDVDGDGVADLVVGRIYGDDLVAPGDAFVLGADGARRLIPTTRGVHGLAIAPDGAIWLGDGWDRDYGHKARGRLSVARASGGAAGGFQTTLVEDIPGDYVIDTIEIADLDGDGQPEVIAKGNTDVRVYHQRGDTWTGTPVAGVVNAIAVGDLDGTRGAEIVTVGTHSEVISLRAVRAP